MKLLPHVLAAMILQAASASAVEQIVTLGDSLTFAYEAEFGFQLDLFFVSYGDGFSSRVRNWAEILNDPIYRHERFDLGTRQNISILGLYDIFFRHKNNWAIPGLKVNGLRRFVNGEETFLNLLDLGPDLTYIIEQSSFNDATDFPLADLKSQIQNTAERLTLFIGGNDVREIYGTVYDGGSAGTFIEDFISDSAFILDWVLTLNPNIQIVVVNVPHIGITPDIKKKCPTDPVKTERVTVVLRELNRRLAELVGARGLGYADVFTPTLSLLGPGPLCIHGITFQNTGDTDGALDYVWLNGPISANFHPNTNAQTIVANEIIAAFNTRYHTGIAPLTATEMLGGLLKKTTSQIDMTFAAWMTGFGLTGLTESDDSDGDGVPAAVEFALGLNPTLRDSHKITSALMYNNGIPALELAYPIRLPVSSHYALAPASSVDLTSPFIPFAVPPVPGTDGIARAR
ncbi:MAG: hypothetical protein NTV46_04185, partial [Verrucomicrobia bacterium]|nr:hypothetical protein [Verrucomicrobiota bacterium]